MPEDDVRSRSGDSRFSRRRVVLALVLGILLIGLVTARGIAGLYTDYLWFDHLRFGGVWTTLIGARLGVALVFVALSFVLVWVNLLLADRMSSPFEATEPHEESMAQVHDAVAHRRGLLRAGVAVVFGLLLGAGAAGQWNDWILFLNRVDFGISDPQFGNDIGFYVFQLPFLGYVVDWLFAALIVTAIVVAGVHFFNGGIRLRLPTNEMQRRAPSGMIQVSTAVKVHLSVLLALVALAKAANYYLDRFDLLFSSRGVVDGASYTDVNAQIPAFNLLIAISVLAAILLLVNIRRRGWVLPTLAVGLWVLVALVVGTAYPAFIQRFRVEPAESTKESQYIERNIEATRTAMGVDDVVIRDFAYDEDLDAEALTRNEETIRNIRLWDPRVLRRTYQRLQEVRTFYRFTDVDIDRYEIDGSPTQILLSTRELSSDSLPADTWENRHLAFTHGFGAVLSPANAVTSEGQPDFLVRNIPPQGEPEIEQPRLYHGESLGGYAVVNSGRDEIDFLREDGTAVPNRYEGDAGVGVGSIHRRLAFALRFADINPLISGFMTSDSRILYLRDIRERVETLAPFLHYDHDPYPVVLDGRVQWVIDAYTTTDRYPYAQGADNSRLASDSGLRHDFNYARNSVKVTVDAYSGDVTYYVVDPEDPIIQSYTQAFPDLFTPNEEVPDDLRAHFRFPEDLFRVQTNMWGRYHIDDPNEFYSQSDRWNIAQDPRSGTAEAVVEATDPETGETTAPTEGRMDPYYLLMRLPGSTDTQFLILQPFVPFSEDDTRRELSAFMVANSDPDDYGQLEVFAMPRDRQVDGPAIVNARINQEPEISQLITLLSRAGSEVLFGNLLIIPVDQSLLYVRPLYVQATGADAVPELKQVIVVFGERIAIRETLQGALAAVFGDAPETLEEGTGADEEAEPAREVQRLLEEAAEAFAEAEAALQDGDFAAYGRHIQAAQDAIEEARGAATTGPLPDGELEEAESGESGESEDAEQPEGAEEG